MRLFRLGGQAAQRVTAMPYGAILELARFARRRVVASVRAQLPQDHQLRIPDEPEREFGKSSPRESDSVRPVQNGISLLAATKTVFQWRHR